MKTITKSIIAGAVALALVTLGTSQAQAHGWPVAVGVAGGVTAGVVVGATIANAYAPAYYAYPAPAYPAPVVVQASAPVCYNPGPVVVGERYPYIYPAVRVGFGWGPRYHYGYRGYRGWRR
ncbi:MAG TPA: hypothetical protein VMR33_11595 [Candidatus Baltobacteraceae bacterium]|jgi:hypothetical protein|nr:hypothetical protein [Candidatus Baltobacteraceae bacterium]